MGVANPGPDYNTRRGDQLGRVNFQRRADWTLFCEYAAWLRTSPWQNETIECPILLGRVIVRWRGVYERFSRDATAGQACRRSGV